MSGIYIPGIEMPVTCCHCPLMGYDPEIEWNDGGRETQGAYICVMTKELIDNTKRENHCPLVPVPEHGRLIDADALLESEPAYTIPNYSSDGYLADAEGAYTEVQIENSPTIIPASPADKETEK